MPKWIGFYDKNGTKIFEGDTVLSYREYVKSDGYKRKNVPDKISVLYKVKWSKTEPKYDFLEIAPIPEHEEFDKEYFFRIVPYFESKPKNMFWKQEDGTMANQWHYDKIKHIKGEKKYKVLWEVEVV